MERSKQAEVLHRTFAALSSLINEGLINRLGPKIHVELGDVSPFSLFSGIANAIGKDPALSLIECQQIINQWRVLFGVSTIVFVVKDSHGQYIKCQLAKKPPEYWMQLDDDAQHMLPLFTNVEWQITE